MFLTCLKFQSNFVSKYSNLFYRHIDKKNSSKTQSTFSSLWRPSSNINPLLRISTNFYSTIQKSEAFKHKITSESNGTTFGKVSSFSQNLNNDRKHFIVIGDTGSGKSSFINAITQANECKVSSQPQSVTQTCQWIKTSLPNLNDCVLIDTPGFGDTRPELNDRDILDIIMNEVLDLHEKAEIGFILCHSVRNTRSHAEIIFENFASTMGPEILKSMMVVLTSSNLLQFDALSREIHQNFVKFLTDKFSMKRELIADFDSVDTLPNQRENVINILSKLPSYDWRQIQFLKEENQVIFNQIKEQEKIQVEVIIPTAVQVEEPGVFTRFYEEMFLHEENKSAWVGWNYILLGIPYLITLKDVKTFICRIPLSDNAYDFRVKYAEAVIAEGDYRDGFAEILEKPDRVELQSTMTFSFARSRSAKIKWKLMIEYEYTEIRKKTIMIDKKEMKLVPRPENEIWDKVRAYQRMQFREKVRKLRLK